MDNLDHSLDECAALTENTWEEISIIQHRADSISGDFSLENQNTSTLEGIQESPSSSSKPALELLPVTPSLREKSPVSQVINFSSSSVDSSNTSTAEDKSNGSTSGLFGRRLPGINAPFLSRTHSATDAVLWHTRSSSRPS